MKRPMDSLILSVSLPLSLLFSIVLMVDNHKALLESLITNQGPLNGSYETHWPFNAEDTPLED